MSFTHWIARLKQGDDEAARKLWGTYFERLQQAARKRLGTAPKRVTDEEDVAVDVFHSLCRGAAEGRFEQLTDRAVLGASKVTFTDEQHDMSALGFFERQVIQTIFVTAGPRNVGQQNLVAGLVAPAIVTHIACRSTYNVDRYVRLGHQRLYQRALARADFAKEAEMYDACFLPRSEFAEFLPRKINVHSCRRGLAHPAFDIRFRERFRRDLL